MAQASDGLALLALLALNQPMALGWLGSFKATASRQAADSIP
jgi:hypothetical protein